MKICKLISIALSCAIAVTTLSVVADAKSEKIEDVPIATENVELAEPEKTLSDSFGKVPKFILRSIDILINIDGAKNRTTFMFGNDSIVTGVKYNGVEKISYTYDLLKRQTAKTINTTNPFVTRYQYKNIYNYRTSTLIDKISYSDGTALSYTYDANGNILTIADASGNIVASYTYDNLNQLTGATVGSDVYAYTYDNGGNITAKTKNGVEVAYTYGNTEWKDLLTNYNSVDIAYDTIGNPLNWINGETFTWGGGRQLTGITKGDNSISYTYDRGGVRTSKNVNGIITDYYLSGTAIIMQKTGDNVIWYTYDENGLKTGFTYNGTAYYYVYNLQGDVIALLNSAGETVARYDYDPWGKVIAITDGQGNDISAIATHIANINPFRYRGYYYDIETGLYYLQSRYYDAEVGRFLNADGYMSTGQGVLGHNMFAYCLNNVINIMDSNGKCGRFLGFLWKLDCGSTTCKTSKNYGVEDPSPFDTFGGFLRHLLRDRDNALTFSMGPTIGVSAGGVSESWSGAVSVDSTYNYAIQTTKSSGTSTGAGASAGLTMSLTSAKNIEDLNGESKSYGFSIAGAVGVAADFVTFNPASQPGKTCYGINISIVIGADAEVHSNINNTQTVGIWNPIKAILDSISGEE